jgi:hypothetical protein
VYFPRFQGKTLHRGRQVFCLNLLFSWWYF